MGVSFLARTPTPLVGREREQGVLRERLAAIHSGRGGLILIGGEAGIGKTALAESLCREAAEQGALVLVGRCYDLTETPPYGPWVELFSQYRPVDGMPPLPAAFAERGTVGEVTSQTTLFQQVLDFLVAPTAHRPLVLLLDDLHWSDPASLDLLRFLARNITAHPLLVLVTYRSDELAAQHPFALVLPAFVREAHATRLTLHRLDRNDLCTLLAVRYALPETDNQRLAAHLYRRADGNPFFAGELLHALEEGQVVRYEEDRWHVGDLTEVTVPPLVRQVIEQRLARFDTGDRRRLGVAAVIGHEVPLGVWASVSDGDEEALAALIEHAVAAHLLDETSDGTHARFVHALIRETLYASILPSRRRQMHQQIGAALLALTNPDPDMVAHHFQQAGDERAREWLVRAGDRAQRAYAWPTAVERFQTALALMEEHGVDAGTRGWLRYRLASLNVFADTQQAIAEVQEVQRLAAVAGDNLLMAIGITRQGHLCYLNGQVRQGLDDLEAGAQAFSSLSAADQERLSTLGLAGAGNEGQAWGELRCLLACAGYYRAALALDEHVLTLNHDAVGPVGSGSPVSWWYRGVGLTHAAFGQPAEAQRAFVTERAVRRAKEDYLEAGLSALNELRFVALPYRTDDLAGRQRLATEAEQLYRRASGQNPRLPPERGRMPLMIVEGQWDEAYAIGQAVLAVGGHGAYLSHAQALLGPLARERGDIAQAATLVQEVLSIGPTAPPDETPWFQDALTLQRLAALLAVDGGDLATARAWLEAHDRWIAWSGTLLGRAEGHIGWTEYYRASGDTEQAYEQGQQAVMQAMGPRQPLALLAAHRLLGELNMGAGRLADAANHLDASLALAVACGAPFEQALTLLAAAELHAATARHGEARSLLEEVRALCTPLGAMPTLARVAALAACLTDAETPPQAYPAHLSEREVEVLRLLAAGRTNREIAAALFISAYTVRNHVTHIMEKTGTTHRAAAAAFAVRHGLT